MSKKELLNYIERKLKTNNIEKLRIIKECSEISYKALKRWVAIFIE